MRVDSDEEPQAGPLISSDAWQIAPEHADPFADLRPDDASCDQIGHGPESAGGVPVYEIDTASCNYLSIWQPSLLDVPADGRLELRVWHFDLVAPVPAEAYIALDIDGTVVFEQIIPIPAD